MKIIKKITGALPGYTVLMQFKSPSLYFPLYVISFPLSIKKYDD